MQHSSASHCYIKLLNIKKEKTKMNYLELVEFYMEEYGYSEDLACRLADMETNPDYCADDYDC